MPHEEQPQREQVAFTRGIVASIGYRLLQPSEATLMKAEAVGQVEVQLRDEKEGWVLWRDVGGTGEEDLEWVGIGYDAGERTVSIALAREADKESSLSCIICFLSGEGYLDRDQGLRAYVGLGLAYGKRMEGGGG
jgi:hypothetical protein